MSSLTPNKGLFKWNTSTDGSQQFNIDTALNENWDKIDNEKIGGRNLVPETSDDWTSVSLPKTALVIKRSTEFFGLNVGDEYVVRLKVKNSNTNKKIRLRIEFYTSDESRDSIYTTEYAQNEDKYLYIKRTLTAAQRNHSEMRILLDANLTSSTVTTTTTEYYKELKLEKGNQITEWTPAPEDKADVSYVDTELSTKLDKKYATKAISTAGWYRIAKFASGSSLKYSNAIIKLWSNWGDAAPQSLILLFDFVRAADCKFTILSSTADTIISKVRIVQVTENNKNVLYLEAYYKANSANDVYVEILDGGEISDVVNFISTTESVGTVLQQKNITAYNINEAIDNKLTLKSMNKTISTTGWYRIAKITRGSSAVFNIFKEWNANAPQIITFIVNDVYTTGCEIEILSCYGKTFLINNLRIVNDEDNIYLEMYYSVNASNGVKVAILTDYLNKFSLVDYEKTEANVGTVLYSTNISASNYNLNKVIGTLSSLATTDKTSLVNALNELRLQTKQFMSGENLSQTTLTNARTFDELMNLNTPSIFEISRNTAITQGAGFPTGAYDYGLLITLISTHDYSKTQIYITDNVTSDTARGVYIRSNLNKNWLKLAGESVAPLS